MDGFITQKVNALGAEPLLFWGSFRPNGTSNPDSANNVGPPGLRPFTVAYAATGQYTVTLPAGLSVPANATIQLTAQAADLSSYFEVMLIGDHALATTRSFIIQAKRAASGNAPASAAGTRIHFAIFGNNSTGA